METTATATATETLLPLVAALVGCQRANRWSDREMAELLGVSRPAWCLYRRGKVPLPHQVLAIVTERGIPLAAAASWYPVDLRQRRERAA